MSLTKVFDLNIEDVLENWEPYHAIREVIANALDVDLNRIRGFSEGHRVTNPPSIPF